MSSEWQATRRQIGQGLAASVAIALGAPSFAEAQDAPADAWAKLAQLSADARKVGVAVPVITVPTQKSAAANADDYRDLLPALVDFIDKLDDAATKTPARAVEIGALKKRASDLLGDVHRAEKHPRQKAEGAPGQLGILAFLASPAHAQSAGDERFRKYHDGYLKLFDSCDVKPENRSEVDWYVGKVTSDKYRARYEAVATAICVPWYFIGIVHALEASFNFDAHLHNGDPLSERTVQVPAGRPPAWLPPNDWESSAKDALAYEKYTEQLDWSLAHTLYRYEAYNGFRSRELQSINSPYLWSFSNHYTSGKYVADGVWSSDAVSKQCGAAVLLRELVAKNVVTFTA